MFLPRVKSEEIYVKTKIKASLKIFYSDETARKSAEATANFMPYLKFTETDTVSE